jgi:hypothetical protein
LPVKGLDPRVELSAMVFLAVFFSLTAAAHFSLYRFALRGLDADHPAARACLLAAISFLAVSFMAAFFLLRWMESPWTINLKVCIDRATTM